MRGILLVASLLVLPTIAGVVAVQAFDGDGGEGPLPSLDADKGHRESDAPLGNPDAPAHDPNQTAGRVRLGDYTWAAPAGDVAGGRVTIALAAFWVPEHIDQLYAEVERVYYGVDRAPARLELRHGNDELASAAFRLDLGDVQPYGQREEVLLGGVPHGGATHTLVYSYEPDPAIVTHDLYIRIHGSWG